MHASDARRFPALAMALALALGSSACGGPPHCDPHPCPSWSRLDPYTCACVDLDSAQASQTLARASEAGAQADAGATPRR